MSQTLTSESFVAGTAEPDSGSPAGVALRTFVSSACGSRNFSTGTATFRGGAELPYHVHDCSEAITILGGSALVMVEGRQYGLGRLDCLHVPAGVPHTVRNTHAAEEMLAHWSFGSAEPRRTFVDGPAEVQHRDRELPAPGDPEWLRRFDDAEVYELSKGAWFRDLFAQRYGSVGICGGYGRFTPGSSLPCHTHHYDESITILSGSASCLVQGRRYELKGLHNAFVPQGKPHRFINSGPDDMEMLWVYAGDEPDRVMVDDRYCSGLLAWPESKV